MIDSKRLMLRPPLPEDFEATADMFSEAGVMIHLGGKLLDREASWTRFLRDIGHWAVEPFGLFSVLEKASGDYVGKVGFARFERDLGKRAETSVEMSWTLRSRFHGRGYALEAATTAQQWFDETVTRRTACIIAPSNIPSQRLAARLGYVEVDQIERTGKSILLLIREAPGQTNR